MFELGNSLREARLRRRLDLSDVEHDTKIRSKYLGALEDEDFAVLPGAVYARGYLRAYSRYLGLDSDLYVDEYNGRFGRYDDQAERAITREATPVPGAPPRSPASLRIASSVALLLLAVLLWAALVMQEGGDANLAGPIAERDAWSRSIDRLTHAPVSRVALRRPTAPAPAIARLGIRAVSGSSWLEVRAGSGSGKVLFSGILGRGARKVFSGRRLAVTVGLPSAVALRVGGRHIQPIGSATRRYLVTPAGIRER